jgi:hypothetical protein
MANSQPSISELHNSLLKGGSAMDAQASSRQFSDTADDGDVGGRPMASFHKRGDCQSGAKIRKAGFPQLAKTSESESDAVAWTAEVGAS